MASPLLGTFKPGDKVTWHPDTLGDLVDLRQRFGDGPFAIVRAAAVSTYCTCPEYSGPRHRRNEYCPNSFAAQNQHPQVVTIRLPNGEILLDEVNGEQVIFSGERFTLLH